MLLDEEQRPIPIDRAKYGEPVPELVISLMLTRETAERARGLLKDWLLKGMDVGESAT